MGFFLSGEKPTTETELWRLIKSLQVTQQLLCKNRQSNGTKAHRQAEEGLDEWKPGCRVIQIVAFHASVCVVFLDEIVLTVLPHLESARFPSATPALLLFLFSAPLKFRAGPLQTLPSWCLDWMREAHGLLATTVLRVAAATDNSGGRDSTGATNCGFNNKNIHLI